MCFYNDGGIIRLKEARVAHDASSNQVLTPSVSVYERVNHLPPDICFSARLPFPPLLSISAVPPHHHHPPHSLKAMCYYCNGIK